MHPLTDHPPVPEWRMHSILDPTPFPTQLIHHQMQRSHHQFFVMQNPRVPLLGMGRLTLTNHLTRHHHHLAECIALSQRQHGQWRRWSCWSKKMIPHSRSYQFPISCMTMHDGGGVANMAAAPVGHFWPAEFAKTASPPLSVTVLIGGGMSGGGSMALLLCMI